jgi:hypothetical protein
MAVTLYLAKILAISVTVAGGDMLDRSNLREVLTVLPPDWRERARRHGILGGHPDTKLDDPDDVMQCVLLHVGCGIPLRQTVRVIAEAGGPKVSHVSLHRKMKRVGPFLQELVSTMADQRRDVGAERWGGYELVVVDGSVQVSPGPSGQGGRLQVALRLADLAAIGAAVMTTGEGETLRRFSWAPGQLAIVDRGFANPPGLGHVVAEGADVLTRVNRGTLPLYDTAGDRIDLLEWVRTLNGRRAHARVAIMRHTTEIHGRLIASRVPAKKVDEARRRVRKEVGNDPVALELAEWVILFTTVPASRLTDTQVTNAYRLRWQVELLFKRWKSLCHLNKLPNYRPDTLVSWLSAKILLLLCTDRLAELAFSELPPPEHPKLRGEVQEHAEVQEHREFREEGGLCLPALEAHLDHLASHRRSHPPHATA